MNEAQRIIYTAFLAVVNDMLFNFTPEHITAMTTLANAITYVREAN